MKSIIAGLVLMSFSNGALADQCVVVGTEKAHAAAKIIKVGDMIGELCEPCGQKPTELGGPTFQEVKSIEVQPWQGETERSTVVINGKMVDLAYTYIKTLESDNYSVVVNAAYLVACKAKRVTRRFVIGD